jgi:hypothetical protein
MARPSVTIFEHANYHGAHTTISEDIPDLSEFSGGYHPHEPDGYLKDAFHDTISSMIVHSGTWEFWTNIHYSGAVYTYSKGTIGFPPNDVISSIRKISDDPK